MAPQFYFRIDKMKPTPGYRTRQDSHGSWLPPRPLGANELEAGDTTGAYFFFDGTTAYEVASLPQGIQHYKSASMYYEDEGGFWAVPFDATRYHVGNGRQTNDDDDDDDDEDAQGDEDDSPPTWVDWTKLRFNWDDHTTNPSYRSWVVIGGQHHHLQAQRPDQRPWIEQMLPHRYHAPPERITPYTQYGALNGELCLLLALVAFSVRARYVREAVTTCLTGQGWRAHGRPAGHGWRSRRGVIVHVWHDPYYHPLSPYERGDLGNIYN